jgi:hypothetical protein
VIRTAKLGKRPIVQSGHAACAIRVSGRVTGFVLNRLFVSHWCHCSSCHEFHWAQATFFARKLILASGGNPVRKRRRYLQTAWEFTRQVDVGKIFREHWFASGVHLAIHKLEMVIGPFGSAA